MEKFARELSWVHFADYFDDQPPVKPGDHGDFFLDDDDNDSPSPTTEPAAHDADLEERWMNDEISLDQLQDLQAANTREPSVGPLEGPSSAPGNISYGVTQGGGAVNAPPHPFLGMVVHPGPFNQHFYPLPIPPGGMMVPLVPYYYLPFMYHPPGPGMYANPGAPPYWSSALVPNLNPGIPIDDTTHDSDESATCYESDLGDESESSTICGSECSDSASTATATSDDQEKQGKDWACSHCALDPDKWALLCPIGVHVLTIPDLEDEDRLEYFITRDAYFFTREEFATHISQHVDTSDTSKDFWACPLPVTTPSGAVMPHCRGRVKVNINKGELDSTTTWGILRHICGSMGHETQRIGYPLVQREPDGDWFPNIGRVGLMPDLQCKYCPMTFSPLWVRDGLLAKHLNEEHPE